MRAALLVGCLGLLGAAAAVAAPPAADLNARVTRLEQLLNSQVLIEMQQRIDSLQIEVQQLRGQTEELNHVIEEMTRRQREQYLDVDRRLSRMESAMETPAAPLVSPDGQQPPDGAALDNDGASAPDASGEPIIPAQERAAYEQAFDLLRSFAYEQAASAFRAFLQTYPSGHYAALAAYWLGETSYAQRDFKQAIADYERLIASFPHSPKVPEAMLKAGLSHYELGDMAAAEKMFNDLIARYPDTTEAAQARNLLAQPGATAE